MDSVVNSEQIVQTAMEIDEHSEIEEHVHQNKKDVYMERKIVINDSNINKSTPLVISGNKAVYTSTQSSSNDEEGYGTTQSSCNKEVGEVIQSEEGYQTMENSDANEMTSGDEITQRAENNVIRKKHNNGGGYEITQNNGETKTMKNSDNDETAGNDKSTQKEEQNDHNYETASRKNEKEFEKVHNDKFPNNAETMNNADGKELSEKLILSEGNQNIAGENRPDKKERKSRLKIIASDSDSEEEVNNIGNEETEEFNEVEKKSGRTLLFDSDSDNEENKNGKEEEQKKLRDLESSDDEDRAVVKKPKKSVLFDSEDEDENSSVSRLDNEDRAEVKKTKKPVLFDSDDEDENSVANKLENESQADEAVNINKLSGLCDSESSEDEDERKSYREGEESSRRENASDIYDEETSSGFMKLTPQQAQKQMKEIQSESQRRVRETNLSLPYHVPKQRTLREFLQKRPKFADSVGIPVQKTPAAMSIKLTNKNLEVISKKLEEREKEVEKFFKSDSEESDADVEDKPEENNNPETKDKSEETDETPKPEPVVEQNAIENSDTTQVENENNSSNKDQMDIDDAPETNEQICDDILKIANDIGHNLRDSEEGEDVCFNEDEVVVNNVNSGDVANGEETVNSEEHQPVLNKKKLLLERIGNIKPRLSGGPNLVIDLEDNTTKPDEVSQLMERFIHHNTRRKSHKNKVQLSIVTVTGSGEIQKEKMSLEVDGEASQPAVLETPGEKLQKLRTELQKQIAEEKTKLWQQKMIHKSNEDDEEEEFDDDLDVYKGENDSCCGDDGEASDAEDETECDKKETNDMDVEEDEDEAEAESDENDGDEEDNVENPNDEDDEENEENEDLECESENGSEVDNTPITASAKKQLKRIIINDESDDDEGEQATGMPATGMNQSGSTDSWDDAPQPGQISNERTPKRVRMDSKPELGFLTPVNHITGLQGLNSGSKFLQESPNSPAFQLPSEPSPLKGWQKKLFSESDLGSTHNNSDDESDRNQPSTLHHPKKIQLEPELPPSTQDLLNLCSGKFTGFTQEYDRNQPSTLHRPEEMQLEPELPPSTQDLLNLCSGKFTGFTQEGSTNPPNTTNKSLDKPTTPADKLIANSTNSHDKNNSDDNLGSVITPSTFQIPKIPPALEDTTSAVDDNDDKLISQILDEDEMEAFKKKFESPVTTVSQANGVNNSAISACINFDSDDEESDNDDGIIGVKKKKNLAALIDSDDDADEENNAGDEEEVYDEEEEGEELGGDEEREVEYDSEENEIEVHKSDKLKKMKIKDFFENEAELSESEWGSADEDENNLDNMEIELGDMEEIDQNKVRRDLEKIHMRQLLDEDKREVKILQELLLEDGELHGAGRQKQFRWKNMDTNNENNDENGPEKENEDCLLDEEDNEEEWRKKRFEREVFLRKNQNTEDQTDAEVDITVSSQILKLGQKFVLKNRVEVQKKVSEEVSGLTSFTMQAKRGSFLTRTDQVLTRVAEYTKETTNLNGAATSKKHFIFQSVSVDKSLEVEKKRKASEIGTPQALKKIRIDKLSPALHKSGNNRLKKLFSNL